MNIKEKMLIVIMAILLITLNCIGFLSSNLLLWGLLNGAFVIGMVPLCTLYARIFKMGIYEDHKINYITSSCKIGDTVAFGSYQQSKNPGNNKEPLEWILLKKDESKALLISKYGLEAKPYNKQIENVSWEECSLRAWLNNDFYNSAFTEEEMGKISTTIISLEASESEKIDLEDKIFLLSMSEAENSDYCELLTKAGCKGYGVSPTEFAKASGAYVNDKNGIGKWWARTPGSKKIAVLFDYNEDPLLPQMDIRLVSYDQACVYPALWINLESLAQ